MAAASNCKNCSTLLDKYEGRFKLIESVKTHPILYKKTHPFYTNRQKAEETWRYVARQNGIRDWKEAQKKWKILRDIYRVQKKKDIATKKTLGVSSVKWRYYENMKFLEGHQDSEVWSVNMDCSPVTLQQLPVNSTLGENYVNEHGENEYEDVIKHVKDEYVDVNDHVVNDYGEIKEYAASEHEDLAECELDEHVGTDSEYVVADSEVNEHLGTESRANEYVVADREIHEHLGTESGVGGYVVADREVNEHLRTESGASEYVVADRVVHEHLRTESGVSEYVVADREINDHEEELSSASSSRIPVINEIQDHFKPFSTGKKIEKQNCLKRKWSENEVLSALHSSSMVAKDLLAAVNRLSPESENSSFCAYLERRLDKLNDKNRKFIIFQIEKLLFELDE